MAPNAIGRISNNKVLVVDDDRDICNAIKALLDFEGFEVITAANGQEAMEMLDDVEPSLILLDLNMPVMDGYTFNAKLQDHNVLRNIPVIIVTATKNHRSIDGIKAVIQKPLDLDHFLTVVMEHCIPEITKAKEA